MSGTPVEAVTWAALALALWPLWVALAVMALVSNLDRVCALVAQVAAWATRPPRGCVCASGAYCARCHDRRYP